MRTAAATASGTPSPAVPAQRIHFLRRHLLAVRSAIAAGCRVTGAFAWSAIDNWEWEKGFTAPFGLIGIDRQTLQRTPKQSLAWLGACARAKRCCNAF